MYADGPAYSLLVVSPDPAMRESLRFLFEVEGYRVAVQDAPPADGDAPLLEGVSCIVADSSKAGEVMVPPGAPPTVMLVGAGLAEAPEGAVLVATPVSGRALLDAVEEACRRHRAGPPPSSP